MDCFLCSREYKTPKQMNELDHGNDSNEAKYHRRRIPCCLQAKSARGHSESSRVTSEVKRSPRREPSDVDVLPLLHLRRVLTMGDITAHHQFQSILSKGIYQKEFRRPF